MRVLVLVSVVFVFACSGETRGGGVIQGTKPTKPGAPSRPPSNEVSSSGDAARPAPNNAAGQDAAPRGGRAGGSAGRGGNAAPRPAGSGAVAGAAGMRDVAGGSRAAASGGTTSVSMPVMDNPPACSPGGACAGSTCCGGALCYQNVCSTDCSQNDDCVSGCCLALNSGQSVCFPSNVCPPPDAPDCVRGGADCSVHSCCDGVGCVENVCINACSSNGDCASGCCYSLRAGQQVCAPATLCAQPPTTNPVAPAAGTRAPPPSGGPLTPITTCNMLTLVGDDGKYLGVASSSPVAADGVCNEVSPYGSKVGANSIFNEVGIYGSEVSSKSAYSEVTSTPPRLRCESGKLLNPVTKSKILGNAIDPDFLCETLAASGH